MKVENCIFLSAIYLLDQKCHSEVSLYEKIFRLCNAFVTIVMV